MGPKRKKATAHAYSEDLSRETQQKTGYAGDQERIRGHESTSLSQSIHMKQSAASTSRISERQAADSVARTSPAHLISTPMATESGVPQAQVRPISGKPKDSSKELRRARMIITVKRTEDYKKWLEENPLQDVVPGDTDEVERASTSKSHPS